MQKDDVIAKIKKCLAMAADASSPNEAAIAMRQAQKLMLIHGVDAETAAAPRIDEAVLDAKMSMRWEGHLTSAIAKSLGLKAYGNRHSEEGAMWRVFGPAERVALAGYAFDLLKKAGLKAYEKYKWSSEGFDDYKIYGRKAKNHFLIGFASAIYDAVDSLHRSPEEIARENAAIVAWKERNALVLRSRKSSSVNVGAAFSRGAEAGKSQTLNRPMSGVGGFARLN